MFFHGTIKNINDPGEKAVNNVDIDNVLTIETCQIHTTQSYNNHCDLYTCFWTL